MSLLPQTLTARVRYRSTDCLLEIPDPQILVCTPTAKDGSQNSGFLSCRASSISLELSKDAVIGAEYDGESKFCIHYSKLRDGTSRETRTLHRTQWMVCSTSEDARGIVRKIRAWALWQRDSTTPNKFLVIINPASGAGKAPEVFEKTIRPVLEDACGFELEVLCSQYSQQITEIVARIDIKSFSGIIFCGGDGTVHEGLQGIYSRADWSSASQIPIAHFPLGSGNGLAASTGLWTTATAMHAVCKGSLGTLDILSVIQGDSRWFSFLGVMYGALTSVDIGTENLRWMGETRFTVGALREIMRMSFYSTKIAYLPLDEKPPQDVTPRKETEELTMLAQGAYRPSQEILSSGAKEWNSIKIPSEPNAVLPDRGFEGEVIDWFETASEGDTGPQGWCMMDTFDVRLAAALNIPYITLSTNFSPQTELGNGAMHIITMPMKPSDSRKGFLDTFLKLDAGEHVQSKAIDVKKVKALLMSPGKEQEYNTWLTVDGEIVPCEAIYMEVHSQACSVFKAPCVHSAAVL